jgi:hypothetical protein
MGGNHSHSSQKPSSSRGPQHRQQQAQSKKKSQEQKSQRQKDRQGKSKESKQQSQRSEQKRQVLPEKISSGSEENFLSLPNDFSPQPPSLSLPEEPQCFDPSPPDSRCFIPLPQQQQHYLPSQQDEYIYRQFHQPVHYPQIGVPSQSLSVQDVMEGAEGFIQLVRLGSKNQKPEEKSRTGVTQAELEVGFLLYSSCSRNALAIEHRPTE